jgi:hypothetical protein
MPTVEALKTKAASLEKKISEKKGTADPAKIREMKKRMKRAQRRVCSIETTAKRVAEKAQKKQKKAEG